jgi:hypothetical protein
MIEITLIFSSTSINQSVSVGDTVYYSNPTTSGGFNVNTTTIELGVVTDIWISAFQGGTGVVCSVDEDIELPTINISYVFFSKDNKINSSTLLGYYGLAEFRNNSTVKAELFATAAEIFESSK